HRAGLALPRHAPIPADAGSDAGIQGGGDAGQSPGAPVWSLKIRCHESRRARSGRLPCSALDVEAHAAVQSERRGMTPDRIWLAFGLLGQAIFVARFIVQWIASERKQESHIPLVFWYLSIVGGIITTGYAIHKRDI